MATIACSMPASVYSRVARKREFSTLSLRSAVENGSFSRLARPYNTSAHRSIGEMQIVNRPRKEGPSKNVMLLSHDWKSIVRGRFRRYCRTAWETDKASVLQGVAYVAVLRRGRFPSTVTLNQTLCDVGACCRRSTTGALAGSVGSLSSVAQRCHVG